jgi:hypothetical protein
MPTEGSLRRTPAFLATLTCFSRLLRVTVPAEHAHFDISMLSRLGAIRFSSQVLLGVVRNRKPIVVRI